MPIRSLVAMRTTSIIMAIIMFVISSVDAAGITKTCDYLTSFEANAGQSCDSIFSNGNFNVDQSIHHPKHLSVVYAAIAAGFIVSLTWIGLAVFSHLKLMSIIKS
jgi:hypothetical protein